MAETTTMLLSIAESFTGADPFMLIDRRKWSAIKLRLAKSVEEASYSDTS